MCRILLLLIFILFVYSQSKAQNLKLTCSEREKKNDYGTYPLLVKTCYIKGFKFISTTYPDYAGRYFSTENEVFVRVRNKYVATKNSKVFNNRQATLLALINDKIQKDFAAFKADNDFKECLSDIESVPEYNMDELEILFYQNKIWFQVHWGLSGACRPVDGTIISFKLSEISKYLN